MSEIESAMEKKGIILPPAPTPMGAYVPAVTARGLVLVSGQLPWQGDQMLHPGKVDGQVSLEDAYQAARLAALNAVAVLKAELGELDQVKRILRITGHVNSSAGFTDQPKVVNGASDLMVEIFAERGLHTRMALGVAELPGNACVAIELMAQAE